MQGTKTLRTPICMKLAQKTGIISYVSTLPQMQPRLIGKSCLFFFFFCITSKRFLYIQFTAVTIEILTRFHIMRFLFAKLHTHIPLLHSSPSHGGETGRRMARASVFALGFTSAVLRPYSHPPP